MLTRAEAGQLLKLANEAVTEASRATCMGSTSGLERGSPASLAWAAFCDRLHSLTSDNE